MGFDVDIATVVNRATGVNMATVQNKSIRNITLFKALKITDDIIHSSEKLLDLW